MNIAEFEKVLKYKRLKKYPEIQTEGFKILEEIKELLVVQTPLVIVNFKILKIYYSKFNPLYIIIQKQ